MRRFASLTRQADFAGLRRRGERVASKSLVMYHSDLRSDDHLSLVGITVSKSIGKAVLRNKVRRRLAAILNDALASRRGMQLLVVARPLAAKASFADLKAEVFSALART